MRECLNCSTRTQSLFCKLGKATLERLSQVKVDQHFTPGQTLFYEGNEPLGLYCMEEGVIKLERVSKTGVVQLLQVFGPGDVIGYRPLFIGGAHEAAAIAVERSKVCFIPKQFFLELVKAEPNLGFELLARISREVRELEDRFQHQVADIASIRIAEAILALVSLHPEHVWTRKDLAAWAGTTPETAMRTLAEFEEKKWIIRQGRRIQVLNRKSLAQYAGEERSLSE